MTPRKPLFLAMAAVGAVAAVALPVARSETVFVPELALIDGAVCRMPQGRSPLLLRLAQAASTGSTKKTEISPAAPAAVTPAVAMSTSARAPTSPAMAAPLTPVGNAAAPPAGGEA